MGWAVLSRMSFAVHTFFRTSLGFFDTMRKKNVIGVKSLKLYQKNPEKVRFTSRVKSVREKEDCDLVTLEESWFYPEGGGQPHDEGTINGKKVLDVFVEDGEIYHKLSAYSGLTLHVPVDCVIDEKVRWDYSVQHTAQHVLTAVLADHHAVETVSFHLGTVHATIDTDRPATWEMLKEVEGKVNDLVREDLKVLAYYRDAYSLKDLPLRKAVSVEEDIRIIQIGQLDYCGCGGTHVESLKDLRLFKVIQVENYKGGSRIYYKAGDRAFRHLEEEEEILALLKEELEVNLDALPFHVRRLKEEKEEYKKTAEIFSKRLAEEMVKGYQEDVVVLPLEEGDDFLKTLGAEMMKKNKIGVFYREDGRIFVFTGKRTSAKLLLSGLKEEFRFRGGGGDTMVQGYIELEEERKPFVSKLYDRLLSLEL